MGRSMMWVTGQNPHGWACSQCDWNYPTPTLLTGPDAKSAYDRLASAKFREHDCASHRQRQGPPPPDSFVQRIRDLVKRGFKPKDAVDLLLQEVMLEHRNDAKVVEQARSEAEDFLRRLRDGII
jgi:hypothetical protein